jgi:hypothetical protein
MNGIKPWRGPREKDSQFIQMLIEASSRPSDVVLDCTAMTGVYFKYPHVILLGFYFFYFIIFFLFLSIYPLLARAKCSMFFCCMHFFRCIIVGMPSRATTHCGTQRRPRAIRWTALVYATCTYSQNRSSRGTIIYIRGPRRSSFSGCSSVEEISIQ